MSAIARELDYTKPQEVGTPVLDFPFEMNGDFSTFTITRHFKQFYAGWLADRLANRYATGVTVDAETGGFLIATSRPVLTATSLQAFDRTFAKIPLPQSIPSSLLITKPALPVSDTNQTIGSYYINRPNSALDSYDAYFIQTVVADSGAPTLYPTGGTYTLSFSGQTTASINYNDVAATVQTRLNALTNITAFGGVVVAGAYNTAAGFTVTFGSVAAGAISTGSLTAVTGATIYSTVYESNSGLTKTFSITTQQSSPAAAVTPSLTPSGSMTIGGGTGGLFVGLPGDLNYYERMVFMVQLNAYTAATGGTFTLTVYGQTTGAITYSTNTAVTSANIQAALNALSNVIARGSYTVTYGSLLYPDGTPRTAPGYICELSTAALSGGTFTLTILGQTTGTIAYNASLATILAAVNALTNVAAFGGAGIAGTSTRDFTITLAAPALIEGNAGSLTVAPAAISITSASAVSLVQTVVFSIKPPPRILSVPAHGISETADAIFIASAATYYPGIAGGTSGGTFSVLDANTILLNVSAGASFAAAATILTLGKRTKADYRPGTTGIRCLKTTNFYLPGVSAGISSIADVPLASNQSDSATFLQAVFAGTGTLNWQVGEIMLWNNSPILQQTTTTLAVADI